MYMFFSESVQRNHPDDSMISFTPFSIFLEYNGKKGEAKRPSESQQKLCAEAHFHVSVVIFIWKFHIHVKLEGKIQTRRVQVK